MLTKTTLKACLAGEPVRTVPASMLWFDGKFVERNRAEVARIKQRHCDDFTVTGAKLHKRAADPELEPGEFTDEWGCLFCASPDGVGAHPTRPIVSSLEDWERYLAQGIPRLDSDVFTSAIKQSVTAQTDHYVVAAFWRTFYERMYMLIGFENLMVHLADETELFRRMLVRLQEFTIQGIELIARSGADAVFLADDWGTQTGLQISPAMWRRYFRPAYAAMIETAHARGLDVWFHSCGNITAIVPEFIDLGLDVLGHLQPSALDLPALARAYRGKLTFFGGVDVQFNLVDGTCDSIRQEVRALIENFHAFEGRYIASPSNSIMPETPMENVCTLFDAIREFGSRP